MPCRGKKPNTLEIAIVLLTFTFLTMNAVILYQESVYQGTMHEPRITKSIFHSPITLFGDADLISFPEKTGNGLVNDPYVISDLEIDAGGIGSCIRLEHISLFLVIHNCTLENSGIGSEDYGIRMTNCTNVNISSCRIESNNNGVLLYGGSSNCWLLDCNISSNVQDGIRMENVEDITITRNRVDANGRYGIHVMGTTTRVQVFLNRVSGNSDSNSHDSSSGENEWFSGVLGNQWGDLPALFPSAVNDGIVWDVIYPINGSNGGSDAYPLVSIQGVRAPLFIDGNQELDELCNFTGSDGLSWSNPHVLEGLKISAGGFSKCFEIKNTNRYLIIKNCTFTAANDSMGDAGIMVENCENINITNCMIKQSSYGIHLKLSHHLNLSRNEITQNSMHGIFIDTSSNISVKTSNISRNGQDGITSVLLADSNISDCTIIDNERHGINFNLPSNDIVRSTNISCNGGRGLFLSSGTSSSLENNTVKDNIDNGVHLESCNCIHVLFNNISSKEISLFLDRSTSTRVRDNAMENGGAFIEGFMVKHFSDQDIDDSNTINGNLLIYHANHTGLNSTNFTNPGQVILANCSNSHLSGLSFNHTSIAVSLFHSNNITVHSCNFSSVSRKAIYLKESPDCNISENIIDVNGTAIHLHYNSDNSSITNNTITTGNTAIHLNNVEDCTCQDNNMVGCGFLLEGNLKEFNSHDIPQNNLVNGDPVYYHVNKSDLQPLDFANAGQVIMINCNHSLVDGQDLSQTTVGLHLIYSKNNTFTNTSFRGNAFGVYATSASTNGNYFLNCNISDNMIGMLFLFGPHDNTIENCTAMDNNDAAFSLEFSADNNTFINNEILDNGDGIRCATGGSAPEGLNITGNNISLNKRHGIFLGQASTCMITGNNISFNDIHGIDLLAGAAGNEIHDNYFAQNAHSQVYSLEPSNSWDNGTHGNYWEDYEDRYPGAINDGITWNESYAINGTPGVNDHHPLFIESHPVARFHTHMSRYGDHVSLVNHPVQFTFNGTIGDWPLGFQWNFGDGSLLEFGKNPIHVYNSAGNFTVDLQVTDRNGDEDTFSILLRVIVPIGDDDGDGISNQDEIFQHGTNPLAMDTDGDTMHDDWELRYPGLLDPKDPTDGNQDPDGDGLLNDEEFIHRTDPANQDTDGDGFSDFIEVKWSTNPLNSFLTPVTNWIIIPAITVGLLILIPFILIKVKKKKAMESIMATVQVDKDHDIDNFDLDEELAKNSSNLQKRIMEKRAMLTRVLEPRRNNLSTAKEFEDQLSGAKKPRKLKKWKQEENITREINEDLEKEINPELVEERCIVCEGSLEGANYVCPKCKTRYCMRCAIMLDERNESCWVCKNSLDF